MKIHEIREIPTVEVKTAQIDIGKELYFSIPFKKYYDMVYRDIYGDLELDDIYFVIEKTDADSVFIAKLDVSEFSLKA